MKSPVKIIFSLSLLFLLGTSMISCSSKSKDTADANGLSEADLAAQREGRFGSGSIPLAEGEGMFRDIYFDYDSSALSDGARQRIEYNVEVLRENSGLKVQLEGHTDERGTADYNMALGGSRAKAVRDVLVSLGVSSSRIETISYGEEVPLDPGQDESAFAKNRRVHFSAMGGATR